MSAPLIAAAVLRPHRVYLAASVNQVYLHGADDSLACVSFGRDQVAQLKSLFDQVTTSAAGLVRKQYPVTVRLELFCERSMTRYHLLFDQLNAFLLEDLAVFFASLIEKFSSPG